MDAPTLEHRLEEVTHAADPIYEMEGLTEELAAHAVGIELVKVILRFMEGHPDVDYGTPGPFVHFVEKFFRAGYEAALLESVQRYPTPHTVWMLHRVINGTTEEQGQREFMKALQNVQEHPQATEETKAAAARFLGEP